MPDFQGRAAAGYLALIASIIVRDSLLADLNHRVAFHSIRSARNEESKKKAADILEGLPTMNKPATDDLFWKNESVALLALASIQGVGYWTLYKLAKTEISFKQVLKIETEEEFVATLKDLGLRSIKLS